MGMFGDLKKLSNSQEVQKGEVAEATISIVNPPSELPLEAPVMPVERRNSQELPSAPSSDLKQRSVELRSDTHSDRSNERTNEVTFERTFVRSKIRHTFDIYQDQLISLREIALKREATFGKRTLLGDLVQEALDLFLSKERNKE